MKFRSALSLLFAGTCLLGPAPAIADVGCPDALDAPAATLDELLFHAQRYGTTTGKVERRELAEAELFARGEPALAFLMERMPVENYRIAVLAMQLVQRELGGERSAPVLLAYLDAEPAATRRMAAYLLGFCPNGGFEARVLPLLADEEAAGAAIRTLGKWAVTSAVPEIVTFMTDDRERRRVMACNALHDIGDASAVPALLTALDDPVFTVRKAAARALAGLGPAAERAMIRALRQARDPARRELIRALGAMRSRRAVRALRPLARSDDAHVRADARAALAAIAGR